MWGEVVASVSNSHEMAIEWLFHLFHPRKGGDSDDR